MACSPRNFATAIRIASLVSIFCVSPLLADESASFREWTDNQGRKVEAKLVGRGEDSVTFEMRDGRQLPFPMERLSPGDREIAETWKPAPPPGEKSEATKEELNFDAPWPDRVSFKDDPEIDIISEDADKGEFIYESANFRYVCDARLAKSVVSGFARMFETTHKYCRELPLGLSGGVKTDGKYLILLFEEFETYVKNGGPPTSAGVFMGSRNLIMVPLQSLGVRPVGSGYMLDRDKSNKTLPHEITHQLTPSVYFRPGSRGWFTEGIAEFVGVTPYRSGSYNVRGNVRDIMDYVIGYGSKNMGGRALGEEITLPHLKEWMLMDYQKFLADPQTNYGGALLITTYFLLIDRDGDATRIRKFLKALHEGKSGQEAIDILLDGDTFESLQEQIAKGLRRYRVKLTFREGY